MQPSRLCAAVERLAELRTSCDEAGWLSWADELDAMLAELRPLAEHAAAVAVAVAAYDREAGSRLGGSGGLMLANGTDVASAGEALDVIARARALRALFGLDAPYWEADDWTLAVIAACDRRLAGAR